MRPLITFVTLALIASAAHAEWEHIPGSMVIGEVYLLESDGLRLYAIGDTGFYRSLDDGYTWRRREIGRGLEDFYITAIGSGDGAVYVGTVDHGVFRSDDGGNTWKHINEGLHIFDDPKRGPRHGIVQQLLVTSSGMVINVGYHYGTHISNNRGDTWHSVYDEWIYPGNKEHNTPDWHFGDSIFSMTEFDGYLWAVYSSSSNIVLRSADKGETWESLPITVSGSRSRFGQITDWVAIGDKLYVAGYTGFGRWNEDELMWENLSQGLPDEPYVNQLAVNRGRIFAGSWRHGVFIFDHHSKTWRPAGLSGVSIVNLVTHHGDLYAALEDGIYRANLQFVTPENKSAVTWGAIKLGNAK